MKKCSSVVWRFFERICDSEDPKRCVAVLCKLCETQYKFFGNTTNLRAHLINKHPIQWELSQNGALDESHFRLEDDESINAPTPKRRKYTRKDKNVRYSVSVNKEDSTGSGSMPKIAIQRVDVLENSDSDLDQETNSSTINLVRQMHADQNSDEEWLEEDPYQITHIETFEPKHRPKKMKYKKIKREVTSPTGLPGFYVAPKTEKILYEDPPHSDEYSVFGEYVANKIRKVKSARTRGNLQQLITTILWQAEYGMYDNAEAVKRVLMYSVQQPEPQPSASVSFGQSNTSVTYEDQVEQQQVQAEEIIEHRPDISTEELASDTLG